MRNAENQFLQANLGSITEQVIKQALEQADQTETIKIPSGTPMGVITKDFTLDAKYRNCNGVVVYMIKSEANLNFRIGLRDNNTNFVQKTSYKHLAANELTPANQRFKAVRIPAKGGKVYVEVQTFNTLTADLEFDIVFSLIEPNR